MKLTRAETIAGAVAAIGSCLTPLSARAAATTLDPLFASEVWLNDRATKANLRGKVVLVDVFTFACYNCQNITPNLRALNRSKPHAELAIVGIHTPETPYERELGNVVQNLERLGITWPVAIDNDQRLWNAYGVEYWPTQLIFDRSGRLHKTIVGDSQDALVDAVIDKLILSSRAPRLRSG